MRSTKVLNICVSLILLFTIKLSNCDLYKKQDLGDVLDQANQATGFEDQQQADPNYIKNEIKDLVKMKIDTDKDGQVSYEELKNYLANLHDWQIKYNVDKQWISYSPQIHEVFSWEGYEPEKRQVLTWDQYFNQTYPELIGMDIGIPINREQDTSRILHPPDKHMPKLIEDKEVADEDDPQIKALKTMVYRADARWKLADENGDTLLTKDEFKFLLYPDEGNEELKALFVREATEDIDSNQDGKICLEEFVNHLQVLADDQEKGNPNWLSSQQENFGRFLDKNKDGVLNTEEIEDWMVPEKSKKFKAEAKRLLDIGDINEDHKLSVTEILDNYDQYLSLLPPEYWRNSHDEFNNQDQARSTMDVENDEVSHDEL